MIKIHPPKIYMLLTMAAYYYAAIGLKNDYVSPDAEYFLGASYLEIVDIKYAVWVFILNVVGSDNVVALYTVGIIFLAYKIAEIIKNYLYFFLIALLPTVFYFSTVVLRDLIFFLAAQILLIYLIAERKSPLLKISTLAAILISLALRPPYGILLMIMILIDRLSGRMIEKLIFFTIVVFCVMGISMLVSVEAYSAYVDFIKEGHGKNLNTFGVLEIDDSQLNEISALRNYFVSFIYFWYVQANGTGAILDVLGFYESIFYSISSALIFYTLVTKQRGQYSKQINMCVLMLVFSIVMASLTQSHDDSMRFRLIFIPFMIFLFVLSIENLSRVSLQLRRGKLKFIRTRLSTRTHGAVGSLIR